MLSALELRDFVLVDAARLETHPGLNVLTGETGAGKSLLVDALGLLAGARAESGWVRRGAARALVQAEFTSDDPASTSSPSPSTSKPSTTSPTTPSPTSASRALVDGGRNHARLDGELVTVAELASAIGAGIAVFSQHAHQSLLAPAAQRDALDRLLDDDARRSLAAYRDAWTERQAVRAELGRLRDASRERLRRADLLDLQLSEIDAARLEPGEEDRLEAEARRLRHADHIATATASALAALDDEAGAVAPMARARRELDAAARHDDRLAALARDLADALQGAQAVAAELQAFLDDFAADPRRLDEVEGRMAMLQRLFAKYGDGSAEVLAFREACARERAGLEASDRRIDRLEARAKELDDALAARAAVVREARAAAGARLARETEPLFDRLALAGARLEVALEPVEPGPHGSERVRFDFAANAGEPSAPLAQAASGGELSRVMLALWLVTGSDRPTLVFDEVDAGVGGRAASAVGELLATLARRHQVLVVTHLAQVAAHADRHVRVGKRSSDGRTVTTLEPLDGSAREEELARMLTGFESEAALATARDLLARAERARTERSVGTSPRHADATPERAADDETTTEGTR